MSFYYRRSESKLDTDGDDDDARETVDDAVDTTTTTTPTYRNVPYHQYIHSTTESRTTSSIDDHIPHRHVPTQQSRRNRYVERRYRSSIDTTTTPSIDDTPLSTPYETTVTVPPSSLTRYRLHRTTASSSSSAAAAVAAVSSLFGG